MNVVKNGFIINPLNTVEEEARQLYNYWKDKPFPNYSKENYDIIKEFNKLKSFDETTLLKDYEINQSMHACGMLWTYFPHWVEVEFDGISLKDAWKNDEMKYQLFLKCCKYVLKHNKNNKLTYNRLRQNSKVYLTKQSVSNFRPTVAKLIYNLYGNKGVVYDMSCGYGGRLLGFLASDCKKYIGVDPCTKTYNGLLLLKNDFEYIDKQVSIHNCGSEDFELTKNSIDLAFTSPPYFDTEKYSKESTQSYMKFPTCELWLNDFLGKTIENCKHGLKDDGHLIINIANVKTYPNLENEAVEIITEKGFRLVNIYNMVLSSIAGKGKKYEPIFVFKKKF